MDFYCGLGGWAEGFVAEGFDVIGFDVERHDYGTGGYPGRLVLQDVRTVTGRQFAPILDRLACFVASPPCTEYSYMAMPWKRAKKIARALRGKDSFPDGYSGSRTVAELNELFEACFRIQREASELAGRWIPMVVENVKGAVPWVGAEKANFGSYYLWGDVWRVGNRVVAGRIGDHPGIRPTRAEKVPGLNWSGYGSPDYKPQGFNVTAAQRYRDGSKNNGGSWFNIAHNTLSGKANNPVQRVEEAGVKQATGGRHGTRNYSSKSDSRKAASALIAKIPFPLARHIARCFKP